MTDTSIPTPVIDLGEVMQRAEESEFWAVRGKAIQAYANLEQGLCAIFSLVSETSIDVAEIIFFKITSADSRFKIIEKLFKRKYGEQYNLFRNSLIEVLNPLTRERNEIVHWNVINIIGTDSNGNTTANVQLTPPGMWRSRSDAPHKNTEEMIAFSSKCDFYAATCTMFHAVMTDAASTFPEAIKQRWLNVFNEAIEYPPPSGHPMAH